MDEITKSSLKQTGRILVSVSPLVALWLIAWGHSLLRLQIGIYAGTALLISIIVARYAHGAILWAMILFFVLALILGAWLKNLWFIRHLGVFPGGMLFTAAMLSMILDRPFVEQYARERTAASAWESVHFVRACFVLTSFWSAVFLLLALLNVAAMSYPAPGELFYLVTQLAVLLVGLVHTTAYTVHARRKRLAATGASADGT